MFRDPRLRPALVPDRRGLAGHPGAKRLILNGALSLASVAVLAAGVAIAAHEPTRQSGDLVQLWLLSDEDGPRARVGLANGTRDVITCDLVVTSDRTVILDRAVVISPGETQEESGLVAPPGSDDVRMEATAQCRAGDRQYDRRAAIGVARS